MTAKKKPAAEARIVTEGTLRLSRAPTAELGAAALQAQKAAGLKAADFIIVAVAPGTADDAMADRIVAAAVRPPTASEKRA